MERSLLLKAFADNPIVLRDLRATMRGTRSFWIQGIYLLLLGILAVTGYAVATNSNLLAVGALANFGPQVVNMVDAQSQLQQVYYFIFLTLAGLITLIAPALTATSVTDERQRQSLDLLVTTPISAFEMLVGKLISSLAFLGLLLALSLPASALCVVLGGATISEVLRSYLMLGIDAIVIASIGLYFSCATKSSLQAIQWTYISVLAFVALTSCAGVISMGSRDSDYSGSVGPLMAIGALSPLMAIIPMAQQGVQLGPIVVPIWIAMLPMAFLTVRLLLTAATYRFGIFGGDSARSLRKQLLIATGIALFAYGLDRFQPGFSIYHYLPGGSEAGNDYARLSLLYQTAFSLVGAFCVAIPFLPGLFVPVRPEDAPPGETQASQMEREKGTFRFSAILLPRHAGALPFFYLWLAIATASAMLGMAIGAGPANAGIVVSDFLPGIVYVAGAGTLFWGVSRWAGRWISKASSARALAFVLFAFYIALPALPLTVANPVNGTEYHNPLYLYTLIGPFLTMNDLGTPSQIAFGALIGSGVLALAFGLAAGVSAGKREA